MKEPLNIVKMKMWWVQVGDAPKELVGLKEKDFYLKVFKDCCHVQEIELDSNSDSSTLIDDERSN